MISVFNDAKRDEYLTSIIDQLDHNAHQLVIDQPAKQPNDEAVFHTGDKLQVVWSELGMRLGMWSTVTDVYTEGRILSYAVETDGTVYRQQRRETFRVPVGPDDGVDAELIVDRNNRIAASLNDLSVTGCRLSLPRDEAREAEVANHMRASVMLTFRHEDGAVFNAPIKVVWQEKSGEGRLDVGAAWEKAEEDFIALVRHFVVRKERTLLKRRTGLDI